MNELSFLAASVVFSLITGVGEAVGIFAPITEGKANRTLSTSLISG
jgi:hypothetical protein